MLADTCFEALKIGFLKGYCIIATSINLKGTLMNKFQFITSHKRCLSLEKLRPNNKNNNSGELFAL